MLKTILQITTYEQVFRQLELSRYNNKISAIALILLLYS